MSINRFTLSAGVLAIFTAAVHTFVGTPEIQNPLFSSGIDDNVALLLYACWHLVTVTLTLSGLALVWSATRPQEAQSLVVSLFVSILWLLFGMVFIVTAVVFGSLSSLFSLPQWTLLIPVGVLGIVGSKRQLVYK